MESKEIGMNSDVAVGLWNVGMGTTDELDGVKRLVTEGQLRQLLT